MRSRTVLAGLVIAGTAFADTKVERSFADGWFRTGDDQRHYGARLDRTDAYTGAASAVLESLVDDPPSFGATAQVTQADLYRGKRIRLTAGLKTERVKDWAGMWLRVDGADGRVLSFDNMAWPASRRLQGDHAWDERSIVLDVPEAGAALFYGTVLAGSGKVWIDQIRVEIVDLMSR